MVVGVGGRRKSTKMPPTHDTIPGRCRARLLRWILKDPPRLLLFFFHHSPAFFLPFFLFFFLRFFLLLFRSTTRPLEYCAHVRDTSTRSRRQPHAAHIHEKKKEKKIIDSNTRAGERAPYMASVGSFDYRRRAFKLSVTEVTPRRCGGTTHCGKHILHPFYSDRPMLSFSMMMLYSFVCHAFCQVFFFRRIFAFPYFLMKCPRNARCYCNDGG